MFGPPALKISHPETYHKGCYSQLPFNVLWSCIHSVGIFYNFSLHPPFSECMYHVQLENTGPMVLDVFVPPGDGGKVGTCLTWKNQNEGACLY